MCLPCTPKRANSVWRFVVVWLSPWNTNAQLGLIFEPVWCCIPAVACLDWISRSNGISDNIFEVNDKWYSTRSLILSIQVAFKRKRRKRVLKFIYIWTSVLFYPLRLAHVYIIKLYVIYELLGCLLGAGAPILFGSPQRKLPPIFCYDYSAKETALLNQGTKESVKW